MGITDDIRMFIFKRYIRPAIDKGEKTITLRSGDIHKEMRLDNRIPAVCNALRSQKTIMIFNELLRTLGYEKEVSLKSKETTPSGYGANCFYTYSFTDIKSTPPEMKVDDVYIFTIKVRDLTEEEIRGIMSNYFGVTLVKRKLNIYGKLKEFDLVNIEHRIVGDFKHFKYEGAANAEMNDIIKYVWLMEKLERYTGVKWKKIIVGSGNEHIFETFAKRNNQWLEDIEIYFVTENQKVKRIR